MFDDSRAYSGFAAKDLDAAQRFYGDTLGLDVKSPEPGELLDITLPGGSAHVLVYQKDDHVPATYTILNFPVADVDKAVDDLKGKGIEMARFDGFEQDPKGISRDDRGPTIAWFRDPSGNILAVHSNESM